MQTAQITIKRILNDWTFERCTISQQIGERWCGWTKCKIECYMQANCVEYFFVNTRTWIRHTNSYYITFGLSWKCAQTAAITNSSSVKWHLQRSFLRFLSRTEVQIWTIVQIAACILCSKRMPLVNFPRHFYQILRRNFSRSIAY